MKRILFLMLAVTMLFSLVSCFEETGPAKEEYDPDASGTKAEELKEETFGLNETAVFENLKITAVEIKESTGSEYLAPEEGNIFVGVKFLVENVSSEDQTVSSLLLFEAYTDDMKSDLSITASTSFEGGTIDGTIAPGKKMEGWYAIEVPADWGTVEIQMKNELLSSSTAKFVFTK